MSASNSPWLAVGCSLAAIALSVGALPADAQVAKGPGSLTGIWANANPASPSANPKTLALRTADGKPAPLQPWAAETLDKRLKASAPGRPFAPAMAQCGPPGAPAMLFYSTPFQILESPGQVVMINESPNYFRIIRLDRPHIEDADPSFKGDSTGHWDGNTLVVDTIAFNDKSSLDAAGTPHSDKLHLVERYRRVGKDAVEVTLTLDDPKAFTKSWTTKAHLKRKSGEINSAVECDGRREALADYRRPAGAPASSDH